MLVSRWGIIVSGMIKSTLWPLSRLLQYIKVNICWHVFPSIEVRPVYSVLFQDMTHFKSYHLSGHQTRLEPHTTLTARPRTLGTFSGSPASGSHNALVRTLFLDTSLTLYHVVLTCHYYTALQATKKKSLNDFIMILLKSHFSKTLVHQDTRHSEPSKLKVSSW